MSSALQFTLLIGLVNKDSKLSPRLQASVESIGYIPTADVYAAPRLVALVGEPVGCYQAPPVVAREGDSGFIPLGVVPEVAGHLLVFPVQAFAVVGVITYPDGSTMTGPDLAKPVGIS